MKKHKCPRCGAENKPVAVPFRLAICGCASCGCQYIVDEDTGYTIREGMTKYPHLNRLKASV